MLQVALRVTVKRNGDAGDHPERPLAAQPEHFVRGEHPGVLPGRAGYPDLAVLEAFEHDFGIVGLDERTGRRRRVDQLFVDFRHRLVGGLHEFVGRGGFPESA